MALPNKQQHPNSPDPELMSKLSDALTVLPKAIQEMLVNKLISTITSSDELKAHVDQVCQDTLSSAATTASSSSTTTTTSISTTTNDELPPLPTSTPTTTSTSTTPLEQSTTASPEVTLPLAAATLAALISQYSAAMNNKGKKSACVLPKVIPIHA